MSLGLPRWMRRPGFRMGLVAGVAAAPVAFASVLLWDRFADHRPGQLDYNAELRVAGKTLTASGAAALELQDGYETIAIACRGLCDDLSIDDQDAIYGGYRVRVLDARGECLFCQWTKRESHGDILVSSIPAAGVSMKASLLAS